MPAIFPNAFCMAFELATYGLVAGIFIRKNEKRYKIPVYFTHSSNAVWTDRMGTGFSSSICIYRRNLYLGTVSDGRIYKCIAGILIQLVLIPALVERLYNMEGTVEWN